MTNINKVRLPRHRQYNWHLLIKDQRWLRKAVLVAVAIVVGLSVFALDGWLKEFGLHADSERARLSLKADMLRLSNFGAPGWTVTDWTEGTSNIKLREVKHGTRNDKDTIK